MRAVYIGLQLTISRSVQPLFPLLSAMLRNFRKPKSVCLWIPRDALTMLKWRRFAEWLKEEKQEVPGETYVQIDWCTRHVDQLHREQSLNNDDA
jgi:hypothetical protein